MKTFCNAGHFLHDSGAVAHGHYENKMTIELRDELEKLTDIVIVPDNLDLKETIAWINKRASKDDIAFSIHFNSHNDSSVRGTEAYFSNDRESELAGIFSQNVAEALGFPNRGAKPDRFSYVGSLGFLRKLKCDSTLVEVGYLTNDKDLLDYNKRKAARGFVNAIKEAKKTMKTLEELRKENSELKRLVSQLLHFISNYIKRLGNKI